MIIFKEALQATIYISEIAGLIGVLIFFGCLFYKIIKSYDV